MNPKDRLLMEAADFLYMAFGFVPEETREKCRYLENALRDWPPADAPVEPVGAQEVAGRETLNANYWKSKYEALLAQPQGARAVALECVRMVREYDDQNDTGDTLAQLADNMEAYAASLSEPAPQERAKVPEGWKLVCEKCGIDQGEHCGWPSNCPTKVHGRSRSDRSE